MVIFYKKYESSFLATVISFISSLFLIYGVCSTGLVFLNSDKGDLKSGLICLAVGIVLFIGAKAVAKSAHVSKLHNNLKYTKRFVAEHPEAHQYCLENNQKYAQDFMNKTGEANFNPEDYRPR